MKSKILLAVWSIVILTSFTGAYHAIHISYGEVSVDNYTLNARLTFYKDDFFKALKDWNGGQLQNMSASKYETLKLNYLENHFAASSDSNNKLKFEIITNDEDNNSIRFELKLTSPYKINFLKLKYTVLFKEYSDQMNLLNVEAPSSKISLIFSSSNPEEKIKL